MLAKQLSVFIENRKGRLNEVLEVLMKNNVNILSLSLADTADYGLLRLIVNDPEKGKQNLLSEGFSTMTTDVVIVKISHKAGSLQELVKTFSINDINVEYMYGLSTEGIDAYIVMKLSNNDKANEIFVKNNITTLSNEDVAKIK
ncbi:MAG: amino acid-binding protein [Firmicutes bacterium]|nr:amino acid-binding protein [Candidatus Caballimonas caccae]